MPWPPGQVTPHPSDTLSTKHPPPTGQKSVCGPPTPEDNFWNSPKAYTAICVTKEMWLAPPGYYTFSQSGDVTSRRRQMTSVQASLCTRPRAEQSWVLVQASTKDTFPCKYISPAGWDLVYRKMLNTCSLRIWGELARLTCRVALFMMLCLRAGYGGYVLHGILNLGHEQNKRRGGFDSCGS